MTLIEDLFGWNGHCIILGNSERYFINYNLSRDSILRLSQKLFNAAPFFFFNSLISVSGIQYPVKVLNITRLIWGIILPICECQDPMVRQFMKVNESILITSLIGDALSLGTHWVYSQSEIAEHIHGTENYSNPISKYHSGKKAGDFTHYGDQVLVLLKSLSDKKCFDLQDFAKEWLAFWKDTKTVSYRDGATRETLENLSSGSSVLASSSLSHDIAGAARIAPFFLLPWRGDDDLFEAVRRQTAFTHGDPSVVEAAEFFARVVLLVKDGQHISDALKSTASMTHWQSIPKKWYDAAVESSNSFDNDFRVAEAHGLGCDISQAFPLTCYLLIKYPEDAAGALIANNRVGGDSAARGMILGMVHGARSHASSLPEKWLKGLSAMDIIQNYIKNF